MKVGAFCCGLGNFASGMKQARHDIVWGVDLDKHACETFKFRFPEATVIHGDLRYAIVEPVDIIVAGFPCQPFSRIGKEKGFDDSRTDTLIHIMDHAESMSAEYVVLENVPASLKYKDHIVATIKQKGYDFVEIVSLNAYTDCGIPQDRTRVFFICSKKQPILYDFSLFVAKYSIDRFINREEKQENHLYYDENSYPIVKNIPESNRNLWNMYGKSRIREKKDGLCPTLLASMGHRW